MVSSISHKLQANQAIFTNAGSLVLTTGVTSVLGFVYWWLAARQFPSATVGLASAMISAMTLLGTISVLGLGTLLIGELPRRPHQAGPLIITALTGSGLVGGILGIVFTLLGPWISSDFKILSGSILNTILFALGVSLTSVTLVLDQALIGLLRGHLQLWRNTLFAVTKLGVLFLVSTVLTDSSSLSIYTTWAIGNVLSLVWIIMLAFQRRNRQHISWPQLYLLRGIWHAALGHHALNLTLQAPTLALPLVVTASLSATANAHFYVAWMIAGFVFVGPGSLTTVLYAVGAAAPEVLASKIRVTLGLSVLIGTGAIVALLLGGEYVLRMFGNSYAVESMISLRILVFVTFPIIIKNHFITIRRIKKQTAGTAVWTTLSGIIELLLAAMGARIGGLPGLCLGWLIAITIESIVMSYTVYKVAFPHTRVLHLISSVRKTRQDPTISSTQHSMTALAELRTTRLGIGLSYSELSERTGISVRQLAAIEYGLQKPSPEQICLLVSAFNSYST